MIVSEPDLDNDIVSLKLFLSVMPRKTTHELFKNALTELEQIVQQLDLDNNDLENASDVIETSVHLTHSCQQNLLTSEHALQDGVIQNKSQPPESFTDE